MQANLQEISTRLDRLEGTLRRLDAELAEIRALLQAAPAEPTPAAPEVSEPTVATAWRALERGRSAEALEHAAAAFDRALAAGDVETIRAVDGFADAAVRLVPSALAATAQNLRRRVAAAAAPVPEAAPMPAPVSLPPPRPAPQPEGEPARPAEPSRLRVWAERELTGSRLFALVGGTLMLLGIVFLFVVAARNGWVGPGERVALGAAASVAALVAGIALRTRYGRLQASLAAVGVGVAGGYATLASAALLYGFVPSWGALLVAAGIAAVGGWIALAWSSQLLAGLALTGAAVAPAAFALDEGISAPAPAFALVVLGATVAAAAPRRWLWLFAVVGAAALGQVVWLVAAAEPNDPGGALAVAAAAVSLLLAAAVLWELTGATEGLDGVAGTVVLLGSGLALGSAHALLPVDRDAGIALAVAALTFGIVALSVGGRRRDPGWVVGAAALLLAGVASADVLSGRSLTIAFALEAAALGALAGRLRTPRFELGALAYVALGAAHVGILALVDDGFWRDGDFRRAAVPALATLAAASLVVALTLPAGRRDARSTGLAASLEPLWDALARSRAEIRATLVALTVALAAAASAGLLSGRWLTIAWAAAAAALGAAARAAGERRLLACAPPVLALAAVHAWAVEAPFSTLALERGEDPLAPLPSLLALAAASAVIASWCRFDQRGLRILGPLAGFERVLDGFAEAAALLRRVLLHVGAVFAVWATGVVLVELSYGWGNTGATALWCALALAALVRDARDRPSWELTAWAVLVFASGKAAAFDWDRLDETPAAVSLLLAAAALLAAGFATRWRKRSGAEHLELASIATAAIAAYAALIAVGSLAGDSDRGFAAGAVLVAAVLAGVAVAPFRSRGGLSWARTVATGYWGLALLTLLLAEAAAVSYGGTRTLTVWGVTAAVLGVGWRWVDEPYVWLAAGGLAAVTVIGTVAFVTPPDRLVDASSHPGAGLSALLACVVAAAAIAWKPPRLGGQERLAAAVAAAAVAVYFVSIAVLELAERVSGASVETDFQRGHTALSALLGLAALGVYVVGLARDARPLRLAGLALFGLAVAKLFLYDLSSLSSITRAFSFLALGAVLLAAAFFAERAVGGDEPRSGGRAGPTPA